MRTTVVALRHEDAAAARRPHQRGRSFRIATMDCSAEEAEIRRALTACPAFAVRFQLGQRVLTIDADELSIAPAPTAVRKSGFDPQPIAGGDRRPAMRWATVMITRSCEARSPSWPGRCSLAIGAEIIGYFAPEILVWRGADLPSRQNIAIWLAGFDVCKEGSDGAAALGG